ncbi:hypothetical protein GCM10012286_53810 [Streptomyces lasiicapitis]|uniref:Uncharacterized protein n=1 Tax=Streptomyces lasiicapitis TaxID=1923961 RepID=A0ABQ2MGS9_9ACTN|nr:hypothetical protein GCM10012286_53810 [Streptomyces lasiicapitis]
MLTVRGAQRPLGSGRNRDRPGRLLPTGAGTYGLRQASEEIAWLNVADGRMTAEALAGSGW